MKDSFYQNTYQEGTKVQLIKLNEADPDVPAGTKGTVINTDANDNVYVRWATGDCFSINPHVDIFKRIF